MKHPKMSWVEYVDDVPAGQAAILDGGLPQGHEVTDGAPFEGWAFEAASVRIDGDSHHNFTAAHVAAAVGSGELVMKALAAWTALADVAVTHHRFTMIMAAARGGHNEVLQTLLETSSDTRRAKRLLSHDHLGMTPLMHAAAAGKTATCEMLIQRGAHVNSHDRKGRSVLMHAALSGCAATVKLLVGSGAEVHHRQATTNRPISMFAAQMGGLAVVHMLNEQHNVVLNDRDAHGTTVMMLAAKSGDPELFQFIRRTARIEDVEARDTDDRTLLHYAAQGASIAILESLLAEPALKKLVNHADAHGVTPTMLAARAGQVPALEVLLAHGAVLQEQDAHHRNVSMYAAESGNPEMLKILLDKGVKVVEGRHRSGSTVAMYAAFSQSHDLLDMLADHGADLTAKDDAGITVAMHAANSGSADALRVLVSRGVKLDGMDHCKRTVAHHAAHSGSLPLLTFLVEQKVSLAGADQFGWTVAMTAARQGNAKVLAFVLDCAGADALKELQARDLAGRSVLSHTAEAGSLEGVKMLASLGAPLFEIDNDGRSALSHAAEHGRSAVVHFLLSKGCPADNKCASTGYTPAHFAASHGCTHSVIELIAAGTPVEQTAKDGKTLLMLASLSGTAELVEWLLEKGASKTPVDAAKKTAKDYALEGRLCRACEKLLE